VIDVAGRVPPHDASAEVAVLGGLLLDPEQVEAVSPVLTPSDFYRTSHAVLFRAILELHEATSSVDLVMLRGHLEDGDHLEAVGGEDYLAHLMAAVPSAANVSHYADRVRIQAGRRAAILAGHELIRMAHEGEPLAAFRPRVEHVLTRVEAAAGAPLTTGTVSTLRNMDISPPEAVVQDRILASGHLLVIVGDGGAGKSWLTLDLAVRLSGAGGAWVEHETCGPLRVLYLGAEETEGSLLERLDVLERAGLRADGERLVYWTPGAEAIDLQNPVDRGRLEQTITAGRFDVVVGDPLAELRVGAEGNDEFLEMFRALRGVRARTGCSMVFAHHTKKKNEHTRAGDGDRSRGGTALRNCSDTFLVLERDGETDRRLLYYSKQKHLLGPEPRPAILEPGEGGVFVFTGRLEEAGGRRRSLDVPAILSAIETAGTEGRSVGDLVEMTGASRATVYRTLEPLLVSGQVMKWKRGRASIYGLGPAAGGGGGYDDT